MDESKELQLSHVLGMVVTSCENEIAQLVSGKTLVSMNIRKQFIRCLLDIQVKIARLLALFRSLKIFAKNPKDFNVPQKDLSFEIVKSMKMIKNVISKPRLSTADLFYVKMFTNNFTPKVKSSSSNFISFLTRINIPMRSAQVKSIVFKNRFIYIYHPDYFSVLMKVLDTGYMKTKFIKLNWSDGVDPDRKYVESLMQKISLFNCYDEGMPEKITKLILNYILSGKYIHIVKRLNEHVSEFNAKIVNKCGIAYIVFPRGFDVDTEFRLEIIKNNVYLTSTHPVFIPPENKVFVEDVNTRVSKLSTLSYCVDKKFFVKKLDFDTNFVGLLTEIRDIIFYTSAKERWSKITLTIVDGLPFRLPCFFLCNGPTITHSMVQIGPDTSIFCLMKIDERTGEIELLNDFANEINQTDDMAKFISDLLTMQQTMIINNLFFRRSNAFFTSSSFISKGIYEYHLSFATDFYVNAQSTKRVPNVIISSKDGKEVWMTAKLVEFYALSSGGKLFNWFFNAVLDLKARLVLLELKKIAEDAGIKTEDAGGNKILFFFDSLIYCLFSISGNMYWELHMFYCYKDIRNPLYTVVFYGNTISCRFSHQIFDLLMAFSSYGNFIHQIKFNEEFNSGVEEVTEITPILSMIKLKKGNIKYAGFDIQDVQYQHWKMYVHCHPFIMKKTTFKFPFTQDVVNNSLSHKLLMKAHFEMGSFARGLVFLLQELKDAFSNWVVMAQGLSSDLIFVYRSILTLSIKLKPKRCLICYFSGHGSSSFLVRPFKSAGINVEMRKNTFCCRTIFTEVNKARENMEKEFLLFVKLKKMKIENFFYEGNTFVGVSADKKLTVRIENNYFTVEMRDRPKATELSKRIMRCNYPLETQVDTNLFIFVLAHQIYGDTLVHLLLLLEVEKLDWVEMRKCIKAGKEKAAVTIINKEDQLSFQVIITNGVIFSRDLKKRVKTNELNYFVSPKESQFHSLMKALQ